MVQMELTMAEIRRIVYDRQHGHCRMCPKILTFEQAHLNEIVPRGIGGKISLDNCEILCVDCHLGIMHGSRNPQFRSQDGKLTRKKKLDCQRRQGNS